MPRYGDRIGHTILVYWWSDFESVCYCGHSFGYVRGGSSFHQAKRQHFEQRHPRRLSLGRIH